MIDTADRLMALLRRGGVASRAQLQQEMGVSQPTFSRLTASMGERLVRIGRGKSTRYGLRRDLAQIGSVWPVFAVGADGHPTLLGRLNALERDQYWFDATSQARGLVTDGLPWLLQDLWPQGFIGRTVPRRYPELNVPERIGDWNDAHVLTYLSLRGEDCVGNLIVGDESLERFMRAAQSQREVMGVAARETEYPRNANAALSGAPPGSSAGGEQPKFTTAYQLDAATIKNVLVKFSPQIADAVSRRWADLLICEHVASHALRGAGVAAAHTQLLYSGDRIFLESQRFDRTGLHGRVGVVTLAALADHLLGRRDNWISAARGLLALGELTSADLDGIRRIAAFGRLIGNTDMHFGNLSFFLSFEGPLALAPAYDMLPMFYAPVGGAVLRERDFEPPTPTADDLDLRPWALAAAERFWAAVSEHELISPQFAEHAERNAARAAAMTA